jgi:hypothetical protein
MTIRFLNSKDGYAKGSNIRVLTAAAEAAYVATGDAVYDAPNVADTAVTLRRVLGQQGIPCIIAPNGTIATNGTYTSGTALPLTYARAWCYFPAGAVVGGLAGWYYVAFSSTTVGQVYTAFQATMAKPYIPAVPVAAVGSNGAFTQTTASDIVMGSVTVPANFLGQFGAVDATFLQAHPNNAGNKITKLRFGGSAVLSTTSTTTLGMTQRKTVQNRAAALQVIHATAETGAAVATSPSLLTVDTTADVAMDVTGQLATATDYLVLEHLSVEALPTP